MQDIFAKVEHFEFFFGRGLIDSEFSTVYISMENPSPIPLKWTCNCTLNMERPPEAFVQPPALPPQLLHQQHVLDEGLFSFPDSGVLQPGEKTQVEFSYQHMYLFHFISIAVYVLSLEGKHDISLLFHVQVTSFELSTRKELKHVIHRVDHFLAISHFPRRTLGLECA